MSMTTGPSRENQESVLSCNTYIQTMDVIFYVYMYVVVMTFDTKLCQYKTRLSVVILENMTWCSHVRKYITECSHENGWTASGIPKVHPFFPKVHPPILGFQYRPRLSPASTTSPYSDFFFRRLSCWRSSPLGRSPVDDLLGQRWSLLSA